MLSSRTETSASQGVADCGPTSGQLVDNNASVEDNKEILRITMGIQEKSLTWENAGRIVVLSQATRPNGNLHRYRTRPTEQSGTDGPAAEERSGGYAARSGVRFTWFPQSALTGRSWEPRHHRRLRPPLESVGTQWVAGRKSSRQRGNPEATRWKTRNSGAAPEGKR